MDEINVHIELTDEIVVEVLQDDDIIVTIQDVDEIEVQAFDYPPEIDRLNQKVIDAAQLAEQAAQSATSASQTANSAVELATTANQAASDAYEIAEQAATSAGEASQAIGEHVAGKTNPHAIDVTQEFAEVKVTDLKPETVTGGIIPSAIYNWFKSLFPSLVDGSLKSFLNGLLSVTNGIATRVGIIEDNSYFDFFRIPTKHLKQYDFFNSARTVGSAITTIAPQLNRIVFHAICVTDTITIDMVRMRIFSPKSLGKMRIGLYEGNPYYPYNRIWQSDEIDQSVAALISRTVSLTLEKNKMYWLAMISDNTDVRLSCYQVYQMTPIKATDSVSTVSHNLIMVEYNYASLPLNLEGMTLNEMFTYFPIISLRKA